MLIRGVKKQEKFEKLCQQVEQFEKRKHRIVVPDTDKSHYSVIDIIIDNISPNYSQRCCTMMLLCIQRQDLLL